MDDDDGYEQFELKQSDLDYALNPGRRHYQSKEEATYGIWAQEEDSDDDNKRPSFSKSKKPDYTKGVSFISGGIKVGEKVVNQDGSEQSTSTPVTDSSFTYKPLPSKPKKQAGANVFAGMRTSASRGAPDPNSFGDWAKKGGKESVIMNMMQKMGYEWGKGLGKEGTGIVEPVQATLRQGRGAIGAYGKEASGPKFGESAADTQRRIAAESEQQIPDNKVDRGQPPKRSWKKNEQTKIRYKTIEEVYEEGGSVPAKLAKNNIKVIDMTGPEQRVYRGYDSFTLRTRIDADDDKRNNFDIKELRHNLDLLVDVNEQNIRRTHSLQESLTDQNTALEYDCEQKKKDYDKGAKEVQRMDIVWDLVETFSKTHTSKSMEEIQDFFVQLKTEHPQEYRLFNLETATIPVVIPLIREYFSKWNPLAIGQEAYGIDLMNKWKKILQEDKPVSSGSIHKLDEISTYDRLLWEGWLPSLRKAALGWDPRDQLDEMLHVMEAWLPILPEWMKENILEQIIIPRIVERVGLWDPLTDVIPIHAWIIPWIHVLGDRLHAVLSQIRQKLAKVLRDKWNPSDISAIAMLKPWVDVWSASTMSAFLGQQIVPKLERFLERMELSPQQFREDDWNAIMGWIGMINPDIIASSLTRYFFPRWYSILCTWLDAPGVDFFEVREWLLSWKNRIPSTLTSFPTIQENIRRGLIAMTQAAEGRRQPGAPIILPPPPVLSAPQAPPLRDLRAPQQQLSLKDVVEMSATRYGLTYVPQKDRLKDGRQVFWFGSVSIYLDRGMVWVMDPKEFNWRPISMEELLPLAGVSV